MSDRIYLDHAATTPLRPEAAAALDLGRSIWANPSSPHAEGRKARQALEDARREVAAALNWTGEAVFTAGASEAASLSLGQAKGGERFVSAVEHDAILKAVPDATILPVDADGSINAQRLADMLLATTRPVVAIQSINSETGNQQDIPALSQIVHEAGGVLIVDASQSAGKMPLPDGADAVIVSAHKLGGPIGIGALLLRDFALLEPVGGQERGYRRGTENLPAAMAFAAALKACREPYCDPAILAPVRERLAPACAEFGAVRLADRLAHPTPYIEALAMQGISGSAQLMRFDMQGFAISQGSACSSGSLRGSHVLQAMDLDPAIAENVIRVSFGWNTTREEVERFCTVWIAMAREGRDKSA
ncbi:aminotransferase class V-fold PLP-dependent enzyme [Altericroceibacterium spongiae]|uniref:Cysteine desulfurase n=1 Tax=Altericroceibacterium spongiae TaxID=2320269 RepID=A0A420EMH9_9SPHN|nr:aminotransferase class V-fold PLP-dependent enzyme [Altericroceibacterium spongiae]RKF21925.1 aminotransferase class V-fold PLP-dependent enzyme [Altericroceibacterium spongiae]